MPVTVIADLDDTLIPSGHLYRIAIWNCGRAITEALGSKSPSVQKLMEFQAALDAKLTEVHGYRNGRFPVGWVQTYRHFCERAEVEPDPAVVVEVYRLADGFRSGPFAPFPGVPETLVALRADGHRLHVVTRGDSALQERKLAECGIRHFFDSVVVVEYGTKHAALGSLKEVHPGPWVMVGDGRRSDIRPALEVGIHAVWLRGGDPWEHLDEELDPSLHDTVDSFSEIVPLIRMIEATKE